MQQIRLEIDGMSCGGCVAAVRAALNDVPGVEVQDVRIGSATVAIDPARINVGGVIDAVQDAGYDAREAA